MGEEAVSYREHYTEKFIARFEEKVRKNVNGCWIWTASRDKDNYGQVRVGPAVLRAHRVAYEIYSGQDIEEGMDIDHLCHIRPCVNKEHLEVVTHEENMQRLRKPVDTWLDEDEAKEEKTTPESILELAIELLEECNVPLPTMKKTKDEPKGYAIVEIGGAPWKDVIFQEGMLPQDKFSRVAVFFRCLRLGVDWREAAVKLLGVSPFTVQNWRENSLFREEMDLAKQEGKKYRYDVLESKHIDELERKIGSAEFKDIANSLGKLRDTDPATKKAAAEAAAAGGGGGVTIIFQTSDRDLALRNLANIGDVVEAEFEEVN